MATVVTGRAREVFFDACMKSPTAHKICKKNSRRDFSYKPISFFSCPESIF